MKEIEIAGVKIQVDVEQTHALYEGGQFESELSDCECDACLLERLALKLFLPKPEVDLLQRFGVDPSRPRMPDQSKPLPYDRLGFMRGHYYWPFYGKLDGAASTPHLSFDRWNWLSVKKEDSRLTALHFQLGDLLNDPAVLLLVASSSLPDIYHELSSLRRELKLGDCPKCGSRMALKGYLKRRSRIPEWFKAPDMQKLNRDRTRRTMMELCPMCGTVEYRAVPNNPPFLAKDFIFRAERRRGKASASEEPPRYHNYFRETPEGGLGNPSPEDPR